jgi:GTP-binding protein
MNLRNVAIIAHVDHGKTTLVDQLLAQSGAFRANEATVERAMDSNDQERERGITILAKATSVLWNGKAGETRINIIDTPGHADFGGEVERILGMVDGCLLLVDAEEGVMPQTKFVLGKALKLGLRPILILNKVDRPHADPDRVLNDTFDLFAAIGATDEQLDFPHLYASGKNGWATVNMGDPQENLAPIFDLIVDHVPPPKAVEKTGEPFQLLSVLIESDPFLGRMLTGRIEAGKALPGMSIKALNRDGVEIERGRITKVLAFRGLKRQPIEDAEAGDIVSIAGLSKATVADTLCAMERTDALPAQPIDPPTISMTCRSTTARWPAAKATRSSPASSATACSRRRSPTSPSRSPRPARKDAYEVAGRGELQLGVLIENMRREGFEVSISRPAWSSRPARTARARAHRGRRHRRRRRILRRGHREALARKAELKEMGPSGAGKTRISLQAPSRALIGYQGEFLTDTRGSGVLNRVFSHYEPYKGAHRRPPQRRAGLQLRRGDRVLRALEPRGPRRDVRGRRREDLPGHDHRREQPRRRPRREPAQGQAAHQHPLRRQGRGRRLTPPRRPTLEQAIAYIEEDELVEVTPKAIRLRKTVLNPSFRKKRVKEDA